MIRELRAANFRCFPSLRIELAPGINFFIGANAQGKTSILEAVCVGTRLQSPRTPRLAEVVLHGESGTAVDLWVRDTHLHFRYEPPKRRIAVDSVEQSGPADFLAVAKVAWFANDDLEIIRGPGARRRATVDFVCAQTEPNYLKNLRTYDRALRSRNALLRDRRPRREIDAFDPVLAESGDILTRLRMDVLEALAPLVAGAVSEISGVKVPVTVNYEPSAPGGVLDALRLSRENETRLGQTVTGPHRDDVKLLLNSKPAAKFASEGQQRTLAIAIKLAQARLIKQRTNKDPIFLIDDVFGELDPGRRRNLIACLPTDSQTLITTTHIDWLENPAPGRQFGVSNGFVEAG